MLLDILDIWTLVGDAVLEGHGTFGMWGLPDKSSSLGVGFEGWTFLRLWSSALCSLVYDGGAVFAPMTKDRSTPMLMFSLSW